MKLSLFPLPREIEAGAGTVRLAGEWICLPAACSDALRDRILEISRQVGQILRCRCRVSAALPSSGVVLLAAKLEAESELPADGFTLSTGPTGIQVRAATESGVFYGVQAAAQLLRQFGRESPVLKITDSPDFPARGVMLDVSRCKVPTVATLKQLIDRLASVRINQLQLYIEHTFAFSAHEAVWHDASPFTHEELADLDRYCRDRYVELVPNLNSFGHMERWLKHQAYKHLAESPAGFEREHGGWSECGSTLYPDQASLDFLAGLYDEFLPHFGSGMVNVGCDETWELGKGRSREEAERDGTTAVYLRFLQQIDQLCVARSRRMQFWGDIILHRPELISELPPDCIALNWGYQADHPFETECAAFADAGVDFYVCPGTSSWNSITGNTDNCLVNLQRAAENGRKFGACGYLITDWGDGGHHQVLPVSYVGFAAGAAYAWGLDQNRGADIGAAVSLHFLEDEDPTGGQVLLELGRTRNCFAAVNPRNCTMIHQMLLTGAEQATDVGDEELLAAEAHVLGLQRLLDDAPLSSEDGCEVRFEVQHAIACTLHSIRRAMHARGGSWTEADLRADLHHIIRTHAAQWLARNRYGGLQESTEKLQQALARIDGLSKK